MEDDDIIAFLYSADGDGYHNALYTINMEANSARFARPRRERPVPMAPQSLEVRKDRREREGTVEPEKSHNSLDYKPCLQLTFSNGPKSRHGLVVGSNPNSDIVLPELDGVSFNHFTFRFDGDYFYVKDLDSTCGTIVKYGRSSDNQPRRKERFIIGGHEFLKEVELIVIEVTEFLQFQVVVPVRDTRSLAYQERVARFREGSAETDELFRELNFDPRPITRRPTRAHTPAAGRPVKVKRELGSGTFGIATHVWDARTGEQSVEKRPKSKERYLEEDWKREAFLMRRVKHDRIVRFLGDDFKPRPMIRLEFVPGGSLLDHLKTHPPFSSSECRQILVQALEGLKYLHGLGPPIMHRDISLSNILIEFRHDGKLSIKYSDFGLAKEGLQWQTLCGNLLYLAPELYNAAQYNPFGTQSKDPYTEAVDIWSLGVVTAELLRCVPKWEKSYQHRGVAWCEKIRDTVGAYFSRTQDRLATFLLANMLPIEPLARGSASECLEGTLTLLGDPEASTGGLQSGVDGNSSSEQTTIRQAMNGHGQVEDEQTVKPETWEELETVEHYINGLARHRSGSLPVDEIRVFVQLPAEALLKRMANPYPENSLFVGSQIEGVGANLDPGYADSSSTSGSSQGGDQADAEAASEPYTTEPSLSSQESSQKAPQGSALGFNDGGEFGSGSMAAKMLKFQEAMRNWNEQADIPIDTTELSKIWNNAQPDESQPDESQPDESPAQESQVELQQATTNVGPPHRKRTWDDALDGQPEVPGMPSQLDGEHRTSQGPVGKRMKNDEAP